MKGKISGKYRYGFVLGGGGVRGFAHLGAIKALREHGIVPEIISGVSAGAIVGAFIASGKSAEETHEIMKELSLMDLSRIQLPKTGLFNLEKLANLLHSNLGKRDLGQLEIPLVVAATDILKGNLQYFTEGNLSKIVQASASIPVLFSPVKIGDSYYVDGGVFSNIPLEPLADVCEKTIIINISPLDKIDSLGNIANIAARTFQLSVNAANKGLEHQCDLYIEAPALSSYPIFDSEYADELFEIGYRYTKELMSNRKGDSGKGFLNRLINVFRSSE